MSKDCEHLISDENDECYPCKVKALFRIIGEREEELKLVSEQRDLIAKKADKVEAHNAQLVEALRTCADPRMNIAKFEMFNEALANQDQSWLEGKIAEAKAEGIEYAVDKYLDQACGAHFSQDTVLNSFRQFAEQLRSKAIQHPPTPKGPGEEA